MIQVCIAVAPPGGPPPDVPPREHPRVMTNAGVIITKMPTPVLANNDFIDLIVKVPIPKRRPAITEIIEVQDICSQAQTRSQTKSLFSKTLKETGDSADMQLFTYCETIMPVLLETLKLHEWTANATSESFDNIDLLLTPVVQRSRMSRAPFEFIGSLSHTLFGTATSREVAAIREMMSLIQEQFQKVTSNRKQTDRLQLHTLNATANRVSDLMNYTLIQREGIMKLDKKIMDLTDYATESRRSLPRFIYITTQFANIRTRTEIMMDILHENRIFLEGLGDLRQGRLTTNMIAPVFMQQILDNTAEQLSGSELSLLLPDISYYYDSFLFSLSTDDENLYIHLRVPVGRAKTHVFELFEISTFPVSINSARYPGYSEIANLPPYILVDSARNVMIELSAKDYSMCMANSIHICPRPLPELTFRMNSSFCSQSLFLAQEDLSYANCDFRVYPYKIAQPYLQSLSDAEFLVSSANHTLIKKCPGMTDRVMECDVCRINLPCKCSLTLAEKTLTSSGQYCKHFELHQVGHAVNVPILKALKIPYTPDMANGLNKDPLDTIIPGLKERINVPKFMQDKNYSMSLQQYVEELASAPQADEGVSWIRFDFMSALDNGYDLLWRCINSIFAGTNFLIVIYLSYKISTIFAALKVLETIMRNSIPMVESKAIDNSIVLTPPTVPAPIIVAYTMDSTLDTMMGVVGIIVIVFFFYRAIRFCRRKCEFIDSCMPDSLISCLKMDLPPPKVPKYYLAVNVGNNKESMLIKISPMFHDSQLLKIIQAPRLRFKRTPTEDGEHYFLEIREGSRQSLKYWFGTEFIHLELPDHVVITKVQAIRFEELVPDLENARYQWYFLTNNDLIPMMIPSEMEDPVNRQVEIGGMSGMIPQSSALAMNIGNRLPGIPENRFSMPTPKPNAPNLAFGQYPVLDPLARPDCEE